MTLYATCLHTVICRRVLHSLYQIYPVHPAHPENPGPFCTSDTGLVLFCYSRISETLYEIFSFFRDRSCDDRHAT